MTDTKKGSAFAHTVIWVLAIFGVALILYRFAKGLGAVTNLNDGYPWGIWIGFDVLAGIALAAGGFVLAGTVHLFGGRKFHPLARPAILTALLGYLLFITGLMVDLGRPWNLWKAIYSWNHESPMFEVAWCVMLYTTVLIFEFAPVVFEWLKWTGLHALWKALVPLAIIVMLGLFTLAMTYSFGWTLLVVIILVIWEICMRIGAMPRDHQMPILMIMAGVMFSFMHQSSLGTLFLMAPHKLHALWYTPILPVLFLLSAILAGPAMVIFESLTTEKTMKLPVHLDLLSSLSKAMPYLLGMYLIVKVVDLLINGGATAAFALNAQTISWWLEILIGIVIPLALFLAPEVRATRAGLFWASFLVVIGVVWNRINVSVVGMLVEEWETYVPTWQEIFISIGLVCCGLVVIQWCMRHLPLHDHEAA